MKPDRSALASIFPPTVVPVGEICSVGPEGAQYNQQFAGRTWREVKRKRLEGHADAFSMMDRRSLAHYIAAFIDLAIEEPDSNSAEYLVYFAGSRGFLGFCDQLTPAQIQYILQTCEWLANEHFFSDDDRSKICNNKNILAERGVAG